MNNVIVPVQSNYPVTPSAPYASNAYSVSAYEELTGLENLNVAEADAQASGTGTSSTGASVEASLSSADLLALSPQALSLLNGIDSSLNPLQVENALQTGLPVIDNSTIGTPATTSANAQLSAIIAAYNSPLGAQPATVSTASTDQNTAGVNATVADQQQIAQIVSQYASAPLTATTVAQINSALSNAGINAQQLSLQEILFAYAAFVPTQNYSDTAANIGLSDELLDA